MKITRIPCFASSFGKVQFVRSSGGYRVLWISQATEGKSLAIGWHTEKVTAKAALWWIRFAVAKERGLPAYTFTDANIDPPLKS